MNAASSNQGAGGRRPRDAGTTYIELLVSIVLLGTVGVAVLTALGAAATGARTHREVAAVQVSLAQAGDQLTQVLPEADDTYVACATPADYEPVVESIDATLTVTSVEYWDRTTGSFTGTCRYASGDRLQLITATVDGAAARDITVVKRPATAAVRGLIDVEPDDRFDP
jgi:type II secretory pathway pseudopilin PulG